MKTLKPGITILDDIVEKKQYEIKAAKIERSLNDLKQIIADNQSLSLVDANKPRQSFVDALKISHKDKEQQKTTKIIAEIKKASPSKGLIRNDFDPEIIARVYEEYGASAISVLTINYGFNGDLEYLRRVKNVTRLPVLRKDFITEEYQIYEACAFNANAILLIASILDTYRMNDFYTLAGELGMDVLIEVHSFDELEKALKCDPAIIGVNNRDLKTFKTDIKRTIELKKSIPDDKIVVCESGIETRMDIEEVEECGVNAFLIGTTLMKSANYGETLKTLLTPL